MGKVTFSNNLINLEILFPPMLNNFPIVIKLIINEGATFGARQSWSLYSKT